jgi:lipopolysaccharide transport system ATP-binding protein
MPGEPAIKVENLGKSYRIGEHNLRQGLLTERVGEVLQAPLRRLRRRHTSFEQRHSDQILHALRDVSFELPPGEALGLVGRNGAGKSTLLKILSRITAPTEGRITIRGRVATLLEVGTGFHPELTGRENLYLNGAILGMNRREIDRRFDEMVAFSGVERFLDTPVKRYSSGMYVRLAFAIAAHLDPEVLLVDEVLAVGDQEFQKKCLGAMQSVAGEGRTVVFVSHNLNAVQRLCGRAFLLEDGRVTRDGSPAEVVGAYLEQIEPNQSGGHAEMVDDIATRPGTGEARLKRVTMTDRDGGLTSGLELGQPFSLVLGFDVSEPFDAAIEVGFWTLEGQRIVSALSVDRAGPAIALAPNETEVRVDFDEVTFVPGEYFISVHVRKMSFPPVDYVERALRFTALNVGAEESDRYPWPVLASVRPQTRWVAEAPAGHRRTTTAATG